MRSPKKQQTKNIWLLNMFTLIVDINNNETLRRLAGEEAGLANPSGFSLEDFMYDNVIIAETMFRHLENTEFVGLSVSESR